MILSQKILNLSNEIRNVQILRVVISFRNSHYKLVPTGFGRSEDLSEHVL